MNRPGDDFDGVRVTAHPRRARRGAAVAIVVAAAAVAAIGWRVSEHRAAVVASRHTADVADAAVASAASQPSTRRETATTPTRGVATTLRDGEDPTPDLSDYVLPGEAPTMKQVIDALHARGIRTGLGAFPPPGTRPPLRGLAVPDDFALPPGYVRHHQATDDGQAIAPILMFSPDIDSIEVHGVRVPIPADRLVPPELAPAGMPLRWVSLPPPRDAGSHP